MNDLELYDLVLLAMGIYEEKSFDTSPKMKWEWIRIIKGIIRESEIDVDFAYEEFGGKPCSPQLTDGINRLLSLDFVQETIQLTEDGAEIAKLKAKKYPDIARRFKKAIRKLDKE